MKAGDLFNLAGQTAIVTGAASGIGLGFAEVLTANGAHVALMDINAEALEQVRARLEADGASVSAHILDIGDRAAVHREIDLVAERQGRLDIAFANAGISSGPGFGFTPDGGIVNVDPDRWDAGMAVNLTGTFATMQAAAKHMKARDYGRIVVTASIAGLVSEPHVGYPYAAAKAAVVNLVRHAAVELAPQGITVNGIAPGPFRTNLAGGKIADPEIARSFAEPVPMKRVASVDEMKGLALLLASPNCSFLTGVTIPIDGGHTAL